VKPAYLEKTAPNQALHRRGKDTNKLNGICRPNIQCKNMTLRNNLENYSQFTLKLGDGTQTTFEHMDREKFSV